MERGDDSMASVDLADRHNDDRTDVSSAAYGSAGARGLRVVGGSGLAQQRTIRHSIGCVGVGLHSGKTISLTLKPAAPDSGIIFRRTDLAGDAALIPARFDHVADTTLCTVIANRHGAKIGTVEHLMAAIAGLGIDNLVVELDGQEVPAMDGSAAPFVFLLECAGIESQARVRRALQVLRRVEVRDGDKVVSLEPATDFELAVGIDFDSRVIGRQQIALTLAPGVFKADLARARTFGFMHEVDQLRAAGLALGGSLDNAIVVQGDKVLNDGGLRMSDEFVRHKALDAIGDLYLAGGPLQARFRAEQPGHKLNNQVLRTLLADPEAYRWVDMRQPSGVEGRSLRSGAAAS